MSGMESSNTAGKTSLTESSPSIPSPKPGKTESEAVKTLFLTRIQLCRVVYDYSDSRRDREAKAEKLNALLELQKFARNSQNVREHIRPHIDLVMDMILTNIVRPLCRDTQSVQNLDISDLGTEPKEVPIDPAWVYLQPLYEFSLCVISDEAMDVQVLKKFVTRRFVEELLQVMDSEEPGERGYLKSVLSRLYSKLVPRRMLIRSVLNSYFLTLIHDSPCLRSPSDLLELLSSIAAGFAIPLRQEHVEFFKNTVIPLHKVKRTGHMNQLMHCAQLFLNKERRLAGPLIEGLLRYWPFGNSPKEMLFLNELLESLEVCEVSSLSPLIPKLFRLLCRYLSGPHLHLTDHVMCFFENSFFLAIFRAYKEITFPMLIPVVTELAETHWHSIIKGNFNALKELIESFDPVLCEEIRGNGQKIGPNRGNFWHNMHNISSRREVEAQWQALIVRAKQVDPGFIPPLLPYSDSHVVGLRNMHGSELSSEDLVPIF